MSGRKNKHIILIAGGDLYKEGGVKRHCWMLSQYLIEKGYGVTLYNHQTRFADEKSLYYPFDKRVRIRLINLCDKKPCRDSITMKLKQDDPDVVMLVNCQSTAFIYALAIRKTGLPFLHSERGGPDHCIVHYSSVRQRELVFSAADYTHVLMDSYIHSLPKYIRHITSAIPSQIEPANQIADSLKPRQDNKFYVISSGRLGWEKDYDLLIKAFSRCAEDFPGWNLEIYGEGPERKILESLINDLNLKTRIFLKGRTKNFDDMLRAYENSHLFVLPSRAEGCPMSLREAMAHGIPVIGYTNCTGTNEIIHHESDGLLVAADNKVKRLEEGMRKLMEDPRLRKRMGEKAIQTAAKYEPQNIHERYEKIILQTAALKSRSKRHWHRLKLFITAPKQRFYSWMQLLYYGIFSSVRRRLILKSIFTSWIDIIINYHREYMMLFGKALFDPQYYLTNNINIMREGEDPLLHYVKTGWKQGLDPSPWFQTSAYNEKYLNNQKTICPLYHYYSNGRFIKYLPMPEFLIFPDMPIKIQDILKTECVRELRSAQSSLLWKLTTPLRIIRKIQMRSKDKPKKDIYFKNLPR